MSDELRVTSDECAARRPRPWTVKETGNWSGEWTSKILDANGSEVAWDVPLANALFIVEAVNRDADPELARVPVADWNRWMQEREDFRNLVRRMIKPLEITREVTNVGKVASAIYGLGNAVSKAQRTEDDLLALINEARKAIGEEAG